MKTGDCIHFIGIQHEHCKAGVRMAEMRDASGLGMARWPCLPSVNKRPCAKSCSSFQPMTAEEERAQWQAFEATLAAVAAGVSPCCQAPLTGPKKGPGVRHCSKCGEFVVRTSNAMEGV